MSRDPAHHPHIATPSLAVFVSLLYCLILVQPVMSESQDIYYITVDTLSDSTLKKAATWSRVAMLFGRGFEQLRLSD